MIAEANHPAVVIASGSKVYQDTAAHQATQTAAAEVPSTHRPRRTVSIRLARTRPARTMPPEPTTSPRLSKMGKESSGIAMTAIKRPDA